MKETTIYRYYALEINHTNIQSEVIDKSTIFPLEDGQTVSAQPTQRWAALLLSMKKQSIYLKKNNLVLNFDTKEQRRLLVHGYEFKIILSNIQSEVIDKSTIISTRRWTNGLGTAHS